MNKPPAFQFYADDFVGSTAAMTNEEVGIYIRLLCFQWSNGSIPNDDARLTQISGGNAKPHGLATAKAKFGLCQDGHLRNARLESERQKQAAFRAKQAENGAKRWETGSGGNAKPHAVAMPGQESGMRVGNALRTPSPSPSTKGEGVQLDVPDNGGGKRSSPLGKLAQKVGGGFSLSERISAERELPRIEKKMKALKSSYSDHQTWSDDDRKQFGLLLKRVKELKTVLNYLA